jgi:hypothetical protein
MIRIGDGIDRRVNLVITEAANNQHLLFAWIGLFFATRFGKIE